MRISMMFKQIHCKLQRECVKSSWLFLRYVIWCRFGWKDSVVAHLWDIWVFSCGFLWIFVLASHAAQINETTLLGKRDRVTNYYIWIQIIDVTKPRQRSNKSIAIALLTFGLSSQLRCEKFCFFVEFDLKRTFQSEHSIDVSRLRDLDGLE